MRYFISTLMAFVLSLQLNGQSPETVVLPRDLALSPDGAQVAFSWRGDIWVGASTGGEIRRLTTHDADDSQPRFSPDGTRLAFVSRRTGSAQIFTMSTAGSVPVQVTRHTEGFSLVDWLPDQSGFLVRASRDHFWRNAGRFFTVGFDIERAPKLLFDAYGHSASLSPDGRVLLYCRESAPTFRKRYVGSEAEQIWRFDMRTEKHTLLHRNTFRNRWPLFAPGSEYLYLWVSEEGGCNNLVGKVNDQIVKLTSFENDGPMFPTISRDGGVVMFRRLFDIYRFDVKTEKHVKVSFTYSGDPTIDPIRKLVHSSASSATFTPDGRVMAFTAGNDIWVMDTVLKEAVQVTRTAAEESSPLFVDNDTLMFISYRGGNPDIWTAGKSDKKAFFWQQEEFELKQLTHNPNVESDLRLLPDGKRVSFLQDRGDLMIMDLDGGNSRRLISSWNRPDYDFSPDSRWLAYAVDDDDFNSDIWITSVDGQFEPFNLSCHPDRDYSPRFSADGTVLAFAGRRWGTESDIAYVYLAREKAEETRRDRTLKEAIKKMEGRRKKGRKSKAAEKKADSRSSSASRPARKSKSKKTEDRKKEVKKVEINFEGIRDRIRRIPIFNSFERGLVFWPEGAKLYFQATVSGKRGVYSVEFPDKLKPKFVTSRSPSGLRPLSEAKKLAGVLGGKPAVFSSSGKVETYAFTARQAVDLGQLAEAVFRQAWMLMRDNFYDERLGNNNWDDVFRRYAPQAKYCIDARSLSDLCNMMLGELNGSHLGFRMSSFPSEESTTRKTWREVTGHLGCRFDPTWKGPGLKIKDIIRESPAAKKSSELHPGELIITIDDKVVDPGINLATVLTGLPDRDVDLLVRDSGGNERHVTIRPTSYRAVRSQLYEMWIEDNRRRVDRLSDGTLGYLHIRAMSGSNLIRFDEELYRVGHGKDGLVIDVRENGGGSITDHLLTCLTQPTHAITRPRGGGEGYPSGRRIYATWDKPIIVLCNQNSFSNAEIFSHAIKTLKRGKVVGVRTAGGVISTGGRSIMGLAFIRMPFRGWYLLDGEDMELNGCRPDVEIWPAPGDWPGGVDTQVDKAVELLMADVKAWKARPRPKLRKASER